MDGRRPREFEGIGAEPEEQQETNDYDSERYLVRGHESIGHMRRRCEYTHR